MKESEVMHRRLLWVVLRTLLVVICIAFFIVFLATEVNLLRVSQIDHMKQLLDLQIQSAVEAASKEMSASVRWILKFNITDSDSEEGGYGSIGEVFEHTDLLWEGLNLHALVFDCGGVPYTVDMLRASILTQNISITAVLSCYDSFLDSSYTFWLSSCLGDDLLLNRFVLSDYFRSNYINLLEYQKNIVLAILYGQLDAPSISTWKYKLHSLYLCQERVYGMAISYNTGSQNAYFQKLHQDEEYLTAMAHLEQLNLLMDQPTKDILLWIEELRGFGGNGTVVGDNTTLAGNSRVVGQDNKTGGNNEFDIDVLIGAYSTCQEKIDGADPEETDIDDADVKKRFGLAVVGSILEIGVALSLLWLVWPTVKKIRKYKRKESFDISPAHRLSNTVREE